LDAINSLIDEGHIIIACGGGGIPVVENATGGLDGLEAVIDKDFVSALLAHNLGAELFVVSTGVEKVAINFNRPNQQWLDKITLSQAKRFLPRGHFPAGSMAPRSRLLPRFSNPAAIAAPSSPIRQNLGRALSGATGTHIVLG
jgi:carbamate kinase